MVFCIGQHEPLGPGLCRIAREQIDAALADCGNPDISPKEKVHSIRTCCKAVRAVLRLLRPLPGDAFEIEDQRLRTAAKLVAGSRDAAVLHDSIASFDDATIDPGAMPAAASDNTLADAVALLNLARDAIESWPSHVHDIDDVAPGFVRSYQHCLDAWQRVIAAPGDRKFHILRRHAKYHWFQLRALMPESESLPGVRVQQLEQLQHLLGQAHDLVVLRNHLASRDRDDKGLLKKVTRRRKKIYEEATNIGRTVFAATAEDLLSDLAQGRAGKVPASAAASVSADP